ncbi:ImmA/IrrE family metallo-endopeptidase [Saccharibacillus sp. O23]|uniref:ImmA/IrrE family metallo-endopeptidase n=1 Tax=Saccharibacillus sp. O23 TaxID=2009338 RepID=UPI0015C617C3|nr:ImmA/IrrE family metallo-endopeptidase [Saccharibacillus sp. O23]
MLQGYQPTAADIWLRDLYSEHHIHLGMHLNFHLIASIWGIQVIYNAVPAFSFWASGLRIISLDNRTAPERQRADFYHELGHIALHDGRQHGLHPLMVQLQEWQARRFQLVAAMPYALLPPLARTWMEYALLLAEIFAVPLDVAIRRVEMIRSRQIYEGRDYRGI